MTQIFVLVYVDGTHKVTQQPDTHDLVSAKCMIVTEPMEYDTVTRTLRVMVNTGRMTPGQRDQCFASYAAACR